jgi:cell division septum initiation protein DivIVA
MRVTGPASSALELEQKLEEVMNQIQEFTAQFGSDELGELKRRRQRAIVLETEIASTRKSLQQLLEERTAEALRAETERLYDCYLC